jgi:hypothetical protein
VAGGAAFGVVPYRRLAGQSGRREPAGLANPVMINAYKQGVPGTVKPFPDGCQSSYPLKSENASPPGTFRVYLSCLSCAELAPPHKASASVVITINKGRILFIARSLDDSNFGIRPAGKYQIEATRAVQIS